MIEKIQKILETKRGSLVTLLVVAAACCTDINDAGANDETDKLTFGGGRDSWYKLVPKEEPLRPSIIRNGMPIIKPKLDLDSGIFRNPRLRRNNKPNYCRNYNLMRRNGRKNFKYEFDSCGPSIRINF